MRLPNKTACITFAILMVLPFRASCEGSAIQEIERINRDISITTKKQELLDVQSRYSESSKRLSALSAPSSVITDEVEAPRVKAIEGVAGRFIAVCVTPNGQVITRNTGEELPGGWVVDAISEKDVVFVRKKKRVSVPVSFSNESLSSRRMMPLPGMLGMPGMPQVQGGMQ